MLRAYGEGRTAPRGRARAAPPVLDGQGLLRAIRTVAARVRVEEKLARLLARRGSRRPPGTRVCNSARDRAAPLALLAATRAMAACAGDFVTPDDVKELAPAVLAHRVTLSPEAEMEGLDLAAVLPAHLRAYRGPPMRAGERLPPALAAAALLARWAPCSGRWPTPARAPPWPSWRLRRRRRPCSGA